MEEHDPFVEQNADSTRESRRNMRRSKQKNRRRQKGRLGCIPTVLAVAGMAVVIILTVALVAGVVLYNSLSTELEADLAILDSMQGVENFQSSYIYDRNGVQLYELFDEGRRTEVPLDRIPFAMRWATIATEDDTFYENPGFDPQSIARAALEWYQEGEIVSGGSTITQQLIREIVFSYEERREQTLRRKLKEAALAWVMTQRFSKDEILELYLNEVYYGNLAYGVEGAANVYFGKAAAELTLPEAAFLAGLVQGPVIYDPYADFSAAKFRQRQVLDLMVLHGYLTTEEADIAFDAPPGVIDDLASPEVSLVAPHFTVEARRALNELEEIDREVLARGGLQIYTTLDMEMQTLAEQVVAQRVEEVRDEYELSNAALVAIHPYTGEILAMVGSVDYHDETIDGAVNSVTALNQPGSTMKPFTYARAFETGWTAANIIWDVPMGYDTGIGQGYDYEPVNYDLRFHGPVRLRDALANSYNIPAVTLLREVGVPDLLEISRRFGMESLVDDPAYYGLSLTLGGGEVTLQEITAGYGVFANQGLLVQPHLIQRIEDADGNIIYKASTEPGEEVLDPRVAFLINSILSDNAARTPAMGSDSDLHLDFPAAAKTGTTNDFRDNWTIGYTPHLAVGVWAGNTDNTPMADGTSGLTGAAPIWHDFMTAVYERSDLTDLLERPELPPLRTEFTAPTQGMREERVCILSSLKDPVPAESGCPRSRTEWFIEWEPGELGEEEGETTPTPAPTATPLTDEEGNQLPFVRQELEKDIFVIGVLPLEPAEGEPERPPEIGEIIKAALGETPDNVPAKDEPPYCILPPEQAALEGGIYQIFIAAPEDEVDAVRARNWSFKQSVPIDPGLVCPPELIEKVEESEPEVPVVYGEESFYRIDSPQNDQEVWGILPVIGTALFDPLFIAYWKVEIQVVDGSPSPWITIGETHTEQIENGVLEYLHAEALQPGLYLLRLVMVRPNGSELQHFVVPITVIPAPAETPTPTPTG